MKPLHTYFSASGLLMHKGSHANLMGILSEYVVDVKLNMKYALSSVNSQ